MQMVSHKVFSKDYHVATEGQMSWQSPSTLCFKVEDWLTVKYYIAMLEVPYSMILN